MYFQAIEHGMSLVVELQIVHEKLLVVRENWSAHDAYEQNRFAAEIFHIQANIVSPAVPWARLEDPDPEAKRLLAKEETPLLAREDRASDRVRTFSI